MTTEYVHWQGRMYKWCTITEVSAGALGSVYAKRRIESLQQDGWIVETFTVGLAKQTIICPQGVGKHHVAEIMMQMEREALPVKEQA